MSSYSLGMSISVVYYSTFTRPAWTTRSPPSSSPTSSTSATPPRWTRSARAAAASGASGTTACRPRARSSAAWRAGAASVCLTELPENLPRLQQLVDHNGASGAVRVEALDWTQPLPEPIASRRRDVVLSADCVFWPELFEPLLSTLAALVQPTTRVLLAVSDRLGRCADFEALAARRGWALTEWQPHALDGAPPLPPSVMPVPAAQPAPRLLVCARAT